MRRAIDDGAEMGLRAQAAVYRAKRKQKAVNALRQAEGVGMCKLAAIRGRESATGDRLAVRAVITIQFYDIIIQYNLTTITTITTITTTI